MLMKAGTGLARATTYDYQLIVSSAEYRVSLVIVGPDVDGTCTIETCMR